MPYIYPVVLPPRTCKHSGGCYEYVPAHRDFCIDHTCQRAQCSHDKSSRNKYCHAHTPKDCAIPGCRSPTHGRFCVAHRCAIKSCESKIMSTHSKLCEHHTMCKLPGCSRRRYNNGFCVDHFLVAQ